MSAFANSAGGTLVYGMTEANRIATGFDGGIDPAQVSIEWIQNCVYGVVQPRIDGLSVHSVEIKPGRFAYVAHVPQGTTAHMSDGRYYKRYDGTGPSRPCIAYSPVEMRALVPREVSTTSSGSRLSQILRNAAEHFDRAGYANTSMEQIADAVGLAKPTLYHYVKSKDEILYLIHREFMAVAFEAVGSPARERLSSSEQVRAVMVDILALMASHRPLVRVFFEHFRDLPARQRKAVVEQRDGYARWLAEIIRRGTGRGEFKAVDPTLTALAIFGACNWAYQWYNPKGKLSAKEIGNAFADIIIDGISRRPPRESSAARTAPARSRLRGPARTRARKR